MNEEELNRLIEKYYNGLSTEEEERTLKTFFSKNDVDGYEAEKAIFSYYAESEAIPDPSPDFEVRILNGINASEINIRSQKIRKYLLAVMSAAAGLLILAGSYFFFTGRSEPVDTYTDPEIAYAETIKILRDVSSQLNRGAQVLEPVGKMNEIRKRSIETINKSTRIVEKNLNYFQRAVDMSQFPSEKNINK
jgi:hypothetical protein